MHQPDEELLDFDEDDLTNISQGSGIQLPPARQREGLDDFLMNLSKKDTIPKQDARRMWAKTSDERDKALKQFRDAKSKIEYWVAKARMLENVVKKHEQDLQSLEVLVIADIMTRQGSNHISCNNRT